MAGYGQNIALVGQPLQHVVQINRHPLPGQVVAIDCRVIIKENRVANGIVGHHKGVVVQALCENLDPPGVFSLHPRCLMGRGRWPWACRESRPTGLSRWCSCPLRITRCGYSRAGSGRGCGRIRSGGDGLRDSRRCKGYRLGRSPFFHVVAGGHIKVAASRALVQRL